MWLKIARARLEKLLFTSALMLTFLGLQGGSVLCNRCMRMHQVGTYLKACITIN